MECPRCHFHTMPGLDLCAQCGAALDENTEGLQTYPPRASERHQRRIARARERAGVLRQRAVRVPAVLRRVGSEMRHGFGEAGPWLGAAWARAGRGLVRLAVGRDSLSRRPTKTLLVAVSLGILPGLGHAYCGFRRRAHWLAGTAAVLLALLLLTFRLDLTGLLAFCLYLVLAASFVDAYFCARAANGDPEPMGWRWLAVASALLTLHLIALAIAVYPFPIVTVPSPALEPPFAGGTRFLAARYHTGLRHGDYVLYEHHYGRLIDRVVGRPGDRVACEAGRVSVNGEPLPPGFIPGRQPRHNAAIEVPPRHWLVYYHEPRRGMLTGTLGDGFVLLTDEQVAAVVLAVYAPADRRRWL